MLLVGLLLYAFASVDCVTITPNLPGIIRESLVQDVMPFLNGLSDNDWSRKRLEDEFNKKSQTSFTKSGLQYKSLTKRHFPLYNNVDSDSFVELNYKGILLDKTTFYDSWEKQSSGIFRVSSLFRGWKEALGYMKEGDIFLFYVPSRLAYGAQGHSRIPPDSDLIMFIEVVKFNADPSWTIQIKQWLGEDLYAPYLKNYHVFVFTGYIMFRRLSSRLIDYFFGSKAQKNRPKAKARHILFSKEDKDVCEVVKKDLEQDISQFAEKAKAHSNCPSGAKGGDLGWFSKGAMVAPFDRVVFSPDAKLNMVLGPVETQFGYHLIVIDEVKGIEESKKEK